MRRTRLAALAVAPLLLVAACGGGDSDDSDSEAPQEGGGGLDGITITGDFDTEPTIELDGLSVTETETAVTSEGDGPAAVGSTDNLLQVTVFNGVTGEKLLSTFDSAPVKVGADQPFFIQGFDEIIDGVPRGSRLLYAAPVEDAVGEEVAPQVGLEPGEPLVAVIDLLSVAPTDVLEGPDGQEVDVADGLPALVEDGGDVTNFDWAGVGRKPGELQVITLIEGDGPAIQAKRLVAFDYFGQVFKADEPFDESFSSAPLVFPVGANGLIDAWDEGLIGITEGSRVLILTPPDKAYGAEGSPPSIPADATLAFVIDVLGVDE